jgi:hypothetical protein
MGTKHTKIMLFMLPIALADDFRRWLWALGRQNEPTVEQPGTTLREFSPTGNAPATHVGLSDIITDDERLAIWGFNAASKTNKEWGEFGLSNEKVRALYDVFTSDGRASRARNSEETYTIDDFIIRETDVGRTLAQMKRVAERVEERRRGRSSDPLSQWALKLSSPLAEIERVDEVQLP